MRVTVIALAVLTSSGLAGAQSAIPGTVEGPSESPSSLTTPSSQIQLTPSATPTPASKPAPKKETPKPKAPVVAKKPATPKPVKATSFGLQ